MRALNHLKKRFEFAVQTNKPIYPNQNDIEAINQLIEFVNGKVDTSLEDALILFYLLQHFKVENIKNEKLKLTDEHKGVFELPNADFLLQKLTNSLKPMDLIIQEIRDELRVHQAINDVPKDKRVPTQVVKEMMEEVLLMAKSNFPILNLLKFKEWKYAKD